MLVVEKSVAVLGYWRRKVSLSFHSHFTTNQLTLYYSHSHTLTTIC